MHLKAHKYVLLALLLFGLGYLVGTSLDMAYRRYTREQAAVNYSESVEAAPNKVGETFAFPREIAGLNRTELLQGEQARDFIHGYLGKDGSIQEAYIGTFKGSRGDFVIFAAFYPSTGKAEEIRESIEKALQEEHPFDDYSVVELYEDCFVNEWQDNNHVHYFFHKGSRLLWVTVQAEDPREILADIHRHF